MNSTDADILFSWGNALLTVAKSGLFASQQEGTQD
jgi:hypothetical protein